MEAIEDLKARARILQRQAGAFEPAALARLRRLDELGTLGDEALAEQVRRRHCLAVVAREHGFAGWSQATTVLRGAEVDDYGTLLCPARCGAHSNVWSADYAEAHGIREELDGYLLAYRRHFFVVDRHYIETLGLDPDDPDWDVLGRDWARPLDADARGRLYGKLIRRSSA